MRDYERLKLQEIVMNIQSDQANKQLIKNFNVLINGVEINEPAVWITAKDFKALAKLARLPQQLYRKTSELPCIVDQGLDSPNRKLGENNG